MKIRRTTGRGPDKVDIQMTPMIDIVFQLLTFFIMSFKISTVEGDFSVKMPLEAPSAATQDIDPHLPPIRLRLTAGPGGELTGIRMGEQQITNFPDLNKHIISLVGTDRGPGSIADEAEVEIDADYNLKYEYTIDAVTAVSGYIDENRRIVKLVEKIKFAPPKKPAAPNL